jgi:hypothetical protein
VPLVKGTKTRGFPLTRFVGHPARPVEGRLGVDDVVELETRVNYIVPKYRDAVICIYDASNLAEGR